MGGFAGCFDTAAVARQMPQASAAHHITVANNIEQCHRYE
jgi:hypothetical protein